MPIEFVGEREGAREMVRLQQRKEGKDGGKERGVITQKIVVNGVRTAGKKRNRSVG